MPNERLQRLFTGRLLKGRSQLASNATDAVDVAVRPIPLANLFAGEVIQHGEVVQLLLKPSRWFVVLNALPFIGVTTLCVASMHLLDLRPFNNVVFNIQLYVLLVVGRLMWSVVQWMGRYYILTDLRVMRLSGVFDAEVQSCPLRKISEIKLYHYFSERVLGKGTIEFVPLEGSPLGWQSISRPARIHERVTAAVRRAQNGGNGCGL